MEQKWWWPLQAVEAAANELRMEVEGFLSRVAA
jgi:hypothetical protein